ncbi:MAG: hypothetical protein ABEJ77_05185 [Halanaeroarchaeum sp.]
MVWIIDDLVAVLVLFANVATFTAVSPLLLLASIGILTVALGSIGVLAVGGVVSALGGR